MENEPLLSVVETDAEELSDTKAGSDLSGKVRLRRIVNKALGKSESSK